jgi:hypothetical protein
MIWVACHCLFLLASEDGGGKNEISQVGAHFTDSGRLCYSLAFFPNPKPW